MLFEQIWRKRLFTHPRSKRILNLPDDLRRTDVGLMYLEYDKIATMLNY